MAIGQFGIIFFHYIALTDAVRAGARVAAVSRQVPNPVGAAQTAAVSAGHDVQLDPSQVSVSYGSWQSGAPVAGSTVSVSASVPYTLSIFGIPVTSGSLSSSTTERVE